MSETNETPRGTVIFDLRDRMRLADAELQLRIESGQVDPISVGQVLLHQTVAAAEIAPTDDYLTQKIFMRQQMRGRG